MTLRRVLALFFLIFSLFGATHRAFAEDTIPETCPSADLIKTIGLKEVELFGETDDPESIYGAYSIDNYNTKQTWLFAIVIPFNQATSTDDALNKAREVLPSLSGTPTPHDEEGDTLCTYQVKGDYKAIAQALLLDDEEESIVEEISYD